MLQVLSYKNTFICSTKNLSILLHFPDLVGFILKFPSRLTSRWDGLKFVIVPVVLPHNHYIPIYSSNLLALSFKFLLGCVYTSYLFKLISWLPFTTRKVIDNDLVEVNINSFTLIYGGTRWSCGSDFNFVIVLIYNYFCMSLLLRVCDNPIVFYHIG